MNGIDQITFLDGDRVGQCMVLRRPGMDSCILSVFTIRRADGRLDAFVSDAGGLKGRRGVTEQFMKGFFEDLRASVAENARIMQHRPRWETIELGGCSTMAEDVEAIKKAGVPMWSQIGGEE